MSEKLTECPNCKTAKHLRIDVICGWIHCKTCTFLTDTPNFDKKVVDSLLSKGEKGKETPRFKVKTLNTTLEGEFVDHLQELLNSGYELQSSYTGVFEGANCAEHVWKAILVKDNHKTD